MPRMEFLWGEAQVGAVLAVLVLVSPGSTRADEELRFQAGGAVRMPAEIAGDMVRLILPGRTYEFQREDFDPIGGGPDPERDWRARREEARRGNAQERFEAAWWALERGLTPEAVMMLREAHDADPSHQPTARLVALLERLDRPVPDPDLSALRGILPGEFRLARGRWAVLLHQHGPGEAGERVELIDRVVITYYLSLAAWGLELRPPTRKLASAFFAEQRDYRAYIEDHAGEAFLGTRGHWHPTLNFVAAFDARSRPDRRRLEAELRSRRAEIDRAAERISTLPPGARLRLELSGEPGRALDRDGALDRLGRLRRDADRLLLLDDLRCRAIDLGTAAHETVHQLVAASGLAPSQEVFPVWLHEGIATQFEVVRGGRWAGLGRVHDLRLPDWREHRRPDLASVLRDEGFARGYRRDRYAAAWALVFYLRKQHPGEFMAFLDLLRGAGAASSPPGPERTLSAFRAAFGQDPEAIEPDWHAYMERLRLPGEGPGPDEG